MSPPLCYVSRIRVCFVVFSRLHRWDWTDYARSGSNGSSSRTIVPVVTAAVTVLVPVTVTVIVIVIVIVILIVIVSIINNNY